MTPANMTPAAIKNVICRPKPSATSPQNCDPAVIEPVKVTV
jgi:hypothetical protein